MRFYGNLTKVDKELREVSGLASTEARDAHGEIILKSAIEAALDDYLEFPAVREMHQLSAVGKTIEATMQDGGLYVTAKIVDDDAWEKVVQGVYLGLSVGGKILARDPDDKKTITKIRLDEISLVDRPSNPLSKIDLWRAAGATDPVARAEAALAKADAAIQQLGQPNSSDALLKIFNEQAAKIDRLQKRVDELLAEPAPPKTAGAYGFIAVSKEDDVAGAGFQKKEARADDLVAALGALSEEDRAMLLIKAAHRLPGRVTTVPAQ
jgi:hypothetical protein